MVHRTFYAGLALFVFGLSVFTNILPLSAINATVTISNLSGSCTSTNVCTGSASLTNTNSSALSGTLWMTVTNQKGQQIVITQSSVGLSPGVATPVTQPLGTLPVGINYTLTAFVVSKYGFGVSISYTAKFSAGGVTVTIDPIGPSIGTITPAPGVYPVTIGQTFTLSYSPGPGCTFGSWMDMLSGTTYTSNPLTFKPWRNFEFVLQLPSQCNTGYPVTPQPGPGGTITPSNVQLIPPSGAGVSFTATAGSTTTGAGTLPWYFIHWNLMMIIGGPGMPIQNATSLLSNPGANPITLTYAQLSVNPLTTAYYLQAVFSPKLALVIMPSSPASAVTTSPAPGTAYYTYGQTQTVTATVAAGYCWQGWIMDGIDQGLSTSITVTMTANHAVLPSTTLAGPGSSCYTPALAGAPAAISQAIGVVSMGLGAMFMFLGVRRRRR